MQLFLLNASFTIEKIIETYESLIWNERYQECGDFELYLQCSAENLELFTPGKYLLRNETDVGMIIEDIRIDVDAENGDHLTITGRSFESILARRIIWSQTNIKTGLQAGLKTLINNAIISPSDTNRKISNFIFEDSIDTAVTGLNIDAQYFGENLYDVIVAVCAEANIGFRVTLNSSNQFVFKLYSGTDRSYNQSINPCIVFSPEFDNLISAEYVEKTQGYANVALVTGEEDGSAKTTSSVGTASGLDRKEMYVDASDISKTVSGTSLSVAEYKLKLEQRAREEMSENNKSLVEFDSEIDASKNYMFNVDFFLGDVVSITSEYGLERNARILEYIVSEDSNGIKTYPTFEILNEEE